MKPHRFRTPNQVSLSPRGEVESTQRFRVEGLADRAKVLRKNTTQAERILWAALRQLKPAGLHFRRQAPFGRYVLDFVCHSAKLVVEIDGSQHGTPEGIESDAKRTKFLESQGYRVVRFWNVDAITNSHGIADAIFRIAKNSISPPPCGEMKHHFSPPPCGEVESAARDFGWGDLRYCTPTRLALCDSCYPDFSARRPPHKGEVEESAS